MFTLKLSVVSAGLNCDRHFQYRTKLLAQQAVTTAAAAGYFVAPEAGEDEELIPWHSVASIHIEEVI